VRVLLVDDEAGKRERIRAFLLAEDPGTDVSEARSFSSAVKVLLSEEFDLVILDMRITTYDVSLADAGGRPRNLGGEEILEKMAREEISTPVVVLTQYTVHVDNKQVAFSRQLEQRMRDANPHFLALIHFGHSTDQWEGELRRVLEKEILR
jgi:CheY-like chemotaxis protein